MVKTYTVLFLLVICMLPETSSAQESVKFGYLQVEIKGTKPTPFRSEGKPDSLYNPLNEVVVSAYRSVENKRKVIQEIAVIGQGAIQQSMASSTVDVLSAQQGISVQKSQQGGGSIILRGMEANRVLLVVDGVRMNNLIYRSGHLQNAITVDPLSLERIEVAFGPASNAFGSDAMGGLVHFFTKTPLFSSTGLKLSGQVYGKYSSATQSWVKHAEVSSSNLRWATYTSLTQSDFGDLRGGKRVNPFYGSLYGQRPSYVVFGSQGDSLVSNPEPWVQRGSGYTQYDLVQKILFRNRPDRRNTLNIQASTSSNIGRYDRLTDPSTLTGLKFSEWHYGPQKRLMASYKWDALHLLGFDGVSLTLYHQNVEESRMNRKFGNPILQSRIENVMVNGFNSDAMKRWGSNTLRSGVDGWFQSVRSRAFGQDVINGGGRTPLDSRYPGGRNEMYSLAAFATHLMEITPELTLTEGFRIGNSVLYSEFSDKTFFPFPYDFIYQRMPVASGSIGAIYTPTDKNKYSFTLSTAYRVPNIDDVSKVFETAPGMLIIPNPGLRPEQAFTAEIGNIRIFQGGHSLEWNIYTTSITDALMVQPFRLNGQDSIVYDGMLAGVYAQQNVQRASIVGYSVRSTVVLAGPWKLSTFLQGTQGKVGFPHQGNLDHIPPFSGRMNLFWQHKGWYLDFYALGNSWKRIEHYQLNGEDNEQYATPEGMPAWITWNASCSFKTGQGMFWQVGVQNILDTQYRTFASGINAPGRNFQAAVRYSF
ncbi:MAG: TonB-dependent receptor [Flavobacteriia bacterium]|nr:TonB-dependent receptor [Flavobacteriia bacterium]NDA07624.1 TonB-dependent receptor [Flavobacteriia bacterium]NDA28453.1 TonB-dependent receptor [Flavobacteriia bacterium]NDD20098.1 TonB-dependent receptor [Flavobacteriia bacterium]